jgi:hypothetical protein
MLLDSVLNLLIDALAIVMEEDGVWILATAFAIQVILEKTVIHVIVVILGVLLPLMHLLLAS